MKQSNATLREGYIALIAVLIMGGIMLTAGLAASRSGIANARSAEGSESSARALALADGCAEEAIVRLRSNSLYAGNEIVSVNTNEYCTIGSIVGVGVTNRTITASAEVDGYTRRVEVFVTTLIPPIEIRYWRLVSAFAI